MAGQRYGNVDRMLVVRRGWLVFDRRFANDYVEISRGRDLERHQYNYNHPDWHPFYQGSEVHTLQSVTKSVASSLIGIAIGHGEIAGTKAPVMPFFAAYDVPDADGRKQEILLRHVLTMRSGIEWHESDRPMNATNTTIQLEASDDWIQFTLEQPMDSEAGQKWTYNSGTSHLLSGIIKMATGKHAHEYAEEHLFGPLGIREYHWKLTPKGFADTEGGLYLRAADLAKFGYLFLRDGVWDDARILPEGWVRQSTDRIVDDVNPNSPRNDRGYGYQWWRVDERGTAIWAGLGYGGQYLLVMPEHDIVAVINSWNIYGGTPGVLGPFIQALLDGVD